MYKSEDIAIKENMVLGLLLIAVILIYGILVRKSLRGARHCFWKSRLEWCLEQDIAKFKKCCPKNLSYRCREGWLNIPKHHYYLVISLMHSSYSLSWKSTAERLANPKASSSYWWPPPRSSWSLPPPPGMFWIIKANCPSRNHVTTENLLWKRRKR